MARICSYCGRKVSNCITSDLEDKVICMKCGSKWVNEKPRKRKPNPVPYITYPNKRDE